ncbi:DUF222 domain-containing protein [Kribbella sp. NPDC023972]|uniref:DUF222 domain-containing protein n=1 Tax=Kribbella sp. NPDC023972 TaxID=3154795 RepID=UPI0033F6F2B5
MARCEVWHKIEHMFDEDLTSLPTADLLESAAAHRAEANRLDARLLEHAQIYADRYHPGLCPTRPRRPSSDGRERAVVLGGDGCPEIAEFAPAEFGVMIGISAGAAADYIGQALALRHRLPLTWARVLAGEATPWKARKIATACLELSYDAARTVDQRVARVVDSLTPGRLDKIVEAAKKHADPDGARKKAEEKNRERGVYVSRCDEFGSKKIFIRTASGHATRFNARIGSIAEALKIIGDTNSLQNRRASAVGIIADPRYTEELLHQAHQHLISTRPATIPDRHARAADAAATPHRTARAVDTAGGSAAPPSAATAEPATEEGRTPRTCDLPEQTGTDGPDRLEDEVPPDDWAEPHLNDEADRDAPHPADSDLPDPLDTLYNEAVEPFDPGLLSDPDAGQPLDAAARRALDARLAQIRYDAHTQPRSRGRLSPGQTEIYVHLTDHTLATGNGVLRAEDIGPLIASQLTELIGHGPYTVKPIIDLHDAVSVDAYEIPDRIRERIKLMHPVEVFPYGTRETHAPMDLDHIQPYDPLGPPGQTNTMNLAPLRRFPHRVKTHGRWKLRRLDHTTLEWTTPNGFTFTVDPTGTHRAPGPLPDD